MTKDPFGAEFSYNALNKLRTSKPYNGQTTTYQYGQLVRTTAAKPLRVRTIPARVAQGGQPFDGRAPGAAGSLRVHPERTDRRATMDWQRPMDVHLEVPEELARRMAPDAAGLARAALEALAAEAVRSGKLSVFEARTWLGIESRYEMDGLLKAHGVLLDLTVDDVLRDAETALASSR